MRKSDIFCEFHLKDLERLAWRSEDSSAMIVNFKLIFRDLKGFLMEKKSGVFSQTAELKLP